MKTQILVVFDTQRVWRPATLNVDSLPSEAKFMPDEVSGKAFFEQGDTLLIEESKLKRMIFNSSQVEYDFDLADDRLSFTARRRRF